MFTEKQWEEARKNNMDKPYNQRRERIATALLAGMLANKNAINEYECVMVKRAISGADALIKALDEGRKGRVMKSISVQSKGSKIVWEQRFILERDRAARLAWIDAEIEKLNKERQAVLELPGK